MTDSHSDLEAWMHAQARLLGLPLAPEHRAGVLLYLQLASSMARRVMDFPLGPADESGQAFRPVGPPSSADGGLS